MIFKFKFIRKTEIQVYIYDTLIIEPISGIVLLD